MTNVIKALHEDGFEITFEYNYKGAQIHPYNPRIKKHVFFEPCDDRNAETFDQKFKEIKALEDKYDKVVNFSYSIEEALVEPEHKPSYFWPHWKREIKNGKICFYDQSMEWAGYTADKYKGWGGELYFKRTEHSHVINQLEPYRDNFIILLALKGSTYQKHIRFLARELCDRWAKRHPDTTIITTGEEACKDWEWPSAKGSTIAPEIGLGDGTHTLVHKSGRMPFRQALNLTRYVDLVITPETGLGIGAGVFGTPKIMLLTTSNLLNIVGNDKNDFSLQSKAYCSPCYRAIYNTRNCPTNDRTGLPLCTDFDINDILDQMEKAYLKKERDWELKEGDVY